MKKQEKKMKVELTFTYWLSKDGQLSGDKIYAEKQTITGEMEITISVLKKIDITGDGSIRKVELNPYYDSKFKGLYFDSIQTVEQLYERYINYPIEKEAAEMEKSWKDAQEKIEYFLKGKDPWFSNWQFNFEKFLDYLIQKYGNRITTEVKEKITVETERRKKVENEAKTERERKEAEEQAKKEQIVKETVEWIKKHGSDRLKAMYERDYEFRLTYELERGKKELPDFIYNRNGEKIDFSKRANPSEDALKKEFKYLQKYPDAVQIGWGHVKRWDGKSGEYVDYEEVDGEPIADSEFIWVHPEWSREGFALIL